VVASFHLKVDTVRGHLYARLVQSVRDPEGRPRKRTLLYLGRVTPEQVVRLKAWLSANPLLPSSAGTLLGDLGLLRKRHTWLYGKEALAHFVFRKLGLPRILSETLQGVPGKGRVARWIETMVVNRLADPTSKYGLLDWMTTSATPLLLGFSAEGLHENLFYRAMDRLGARQDSLERLLYQRVVRTTTEHPEILYHDLTSTYYEGQPGGLVQFGHNRDRVEGCPQVNWGMVVTPEGLPITAQVHPGNAKDETTVSGMRERLERLFGLTGGLYVGDRGMRTADLVTELTTHGFHYILAEKNSGKVAQEALELARDLTPVAVSATNVVREAVTKDGVRHIVLLNEQRRREELEVLARRQQEGQAILSRWRQRVGKVHHHEVLKGAQAELRKAGLQDLFDLGFDEGTIQGLTSEWKARVRRTKQWAGWWVLATDTELPAEEVARIYQGLAVIERGWREIKSVLEVRPLNHRLDRRIEAHLLLCELAFLLERWIELRVRKAGLKGPRGLLTGVGAVERFRALTLDELEAEGSGKTKFLVTELQAEHREVLEALGVDANAFQKGWTRLD
jgi:transposase